MTADLLVIVPSRGRPASIDRLWNAIKATAADPVDLLVVLDDDDDHQYPRLNGVFYLVVPRMRLARSYNAALEHIDSDLTRWPHRYLGLFNDDHVPETRDWDRVLVDTIKTQGGGYAYAADGIQKILCTAPIVDRHIPTTLGWIGLPGLTHCWIDNVWLELGTRLGKITKLDDVMIRHHHALVGLAEPDATYAEGGQNTDLAEQDRLIYAAWLNDRANADIERLQGGGVAR
jgi:hypothetical protein